MEVEAAVGAHLCNFTCGFMQSRKSGASPWRPDGGCGRVFRLSAFSFFFSLHHQPTLLQISLKRTDELQWCSCFPSCGIGCPPLCFSAVTARRRSQQPAYASYKEKQRIRATGSLLPCRPCARNTLPPCPRHHRCIIHSDFGFFLSYFYSVCSVPSSPVCCVFVRPNLSVLRIHPTIVVSPARPVGK